ncbi:methylated-DNA--[protein]-cysteine S-methyltransferase [uncultured Thiocystis sp.]|jgi:methylated-DNA-[protein]-cysteine S-methyltransferase|uniref:methylated-DNA--[protein]-cysteine S-methyltransferase n=1 Tax=uncultured Thiocystis sp. TaxID=1202134 RepID=UPI0025FF787B|nr:methylated-DNA--[protein]-cysteine S-methyltransferase [uncultured Thiocystis sp.]
MPHALMTTPFGLIGLRWSDGALTGVDLDPRLSRRDDATAAQESCVDLADRERSEASMTREVSGEDMRATIMRQLTDYFGRREVGFDLPLVLAGTPFQHRVWALLRTIPAGETRTYGEIARALGTAARSVGQACRANPCPIVVPCHRVVAARGLGGFAGDTSGRRLAIKRWLLHHEGVAERSF